MLKGANIEGEDEEEEKIQDMEGLSRLFLGLFFRPLGIPLGTPSGNNSRIPSIPQDSPLRIQASRVSVSFVGRCALWDRK